eukprot:705719-Hanusia_phi.AAC.1
MHTDNCASHASCTDTYASFECSCEPGTPSVAMSSGMEPDGESRVRRLRDRVRGRGRVRDAARRVWQDEGVRQHGGKLRVPVRGG